MVEGISEGAAHLSIDLNAIGPGWPKAERQRKSSGIVIRRMLGEGPRLSVPRIIEESLFCRSQFAG